jgi:hypothetical protein
MSSHSLEQFLALNPKLIKKGVGSEGTSDLYTCPWCAMKGKKKNKYMNNF